jgi:hypothetical protein
MFFEKNFTEIVPHFFVATSVILYIFVANYLGQELTELKKEIFLAA